MAAPRKKTPKEKARESFAYFCAYYFEVLCTALELDMGPGGFHRDMMDSLDRHIRGGSKTTDDEWTNWFFLVAPRGYGKSAIIRMLLTYFACYPELIGSSDRVIVNLSNTDELAQENLSYVKNFLIYYDRITDDFGDFKGPTGSWNVTEIVTVPGPGRPSIRILARGPGIRSLHPGVLVIDDLEDLEDVESDAKHKTMLAFYVRDLVPAINEKMCLWIGTLLGNRAIFTQIARGPKGQVGFPAYGWAGKEYFACDPKAFKERGAIEKPLWSQKRGIEWLEAQRKKMSLVPGAFEHEFLNDPSVSINYIWHPDWWPAVEIPPKDTNLGEWDPQAQRFRPFKHATLLTTIDPATSAASTKKGKDRRSDPTGCITYALCDNPKTSEGLPNKWYGHAWIIGCWEKKLIFPDVITEVDRWVKSWGAENHNVGIELSQGGAYFQQLRHMWAEERADIHPVELSPYGKNKIERAQQGSFIVQMGRVHLCPGLDPNMKRDLDNAPNSHRDHYMDCQAYAQQWIIERTLPTAPAKKEPDLTPVQVMIKNLSRVEEDEPAGVPYGVSGFPC